MSNNEIIIKEYEFLLKKFEMSVIEFDILKAKYQQLIAEFEEYKTKSREILSSVDTTKTAQTANKPVQENKLHLLNKLIYDSSRHIVRKNKISMRVALLMWYIYEHSPVTTPQGMAHLQCTRVTFQRDINILKQLGWIRLRASRIFGEYVVTEAGLAAIESLGKPKKEPSEKSAD